LKNTDKKMIELGLETANRRLVYWDRIWSEYSNDKVNIGEKLALVLRTIIKAFPLHKDIRALSIGSSNEPQFRILETACRGGLYLLDIEKAALDKVRERVKRQSISHVKTIQDDYKKCFFRDKDAKEFLLCQLAGVKVNLIALHHSLYYCREKNWYEIFRNLYRHILARKGAIHTVLMSAEAGSQNTTTWLYNHFAGKYFGLRNDQDLLTFQKELRADKYFRPAQIMATSSRVSFWADDFKKFMAVIWMILLYPDVCPYSQRQREEITEFVYKRLWQKRKPLVQKQDHMVIYRDIGFKGLI